MKIKVHDLVIIILIIAFTTMGLALLNHVYESNVHECLSNPLVYGANKYSEMYNYEFVGSGRLLIDDNVNIISPTFIFDRNNLTLATSYFG